MHQHPDLIPLWPRRKPRLREVKPLAQDTTCRWYKSIIDLSSRGPLALASSCSICPPETREQQRLLLRAQTPLTCSLLLSHLSVFLNQCLPVLSSLLPTYSNSPPGSPETDFLWADPSTSPPCVMYNWDLWLEASSFLGASLQKSQDRKITGLISG